MGALMNIWRVPDLRQAAGLHVHDHRALPVRLLAARAGRQHELAAHVLRRRSQRHDPQRAQHLRRRRAREPLAVRARDHAVHHGLDHHAADADRRPGAREAVEGRRVGLQEDHAVHALPDGRPGGLAVGGLRVPVPQRLGHRRQRPAAGSHGRPLHPDRDDAHGGHDAADVDGRADHPARRRQRHLAADLRLDPDCRASGDRRLAATAARSRSSRSRS